MSQAEQDLVELALEVQKAGAKLQLQLLQTLNATSSLSMKRVLQPLACVVAVAVKAPQALQDKLTSLKGDTHPRAMAALQRLTAAGHKNPLTIVEAQLSRRVHSMLPQGAAQAEEKGQALISSAIPMGDQLRSLGRRFAALVLTAGSYHSLTVLTEISDFLISALELGNSKKHDFSKFEELLLPIDVLEEALTGMCLVIFQVPTAADAQAAYLVNDAEARLAAALSTEATALGFKYC